MDALVARLGLPLIVKPARGGSALGCTVVRDARRRCPRAMVDRVRLRRRRAASSGSSSGTEVAVPVVDDRRRARGRCPSSGSSPTAGVYDYTARYTAGSDRVRGAGEAVRRRSPRSAPGSRVAAHEALGLRDLSRSDLIVDADGTVWFLEVNVAPGLTETSTVPLAVQAAGLDLGELMAALVRRATSR